MVAFAIVPTDGPFLCSACELWEPTAVVGLFNPKVGFLISSPLEIVEDLASDMPNRDEAPLPASSLEDFIDLVEESPMDVPGRVEVWPILLVVGRGDLPVALIPPFELSIVSIYPLRSVIVV